MKLFRDYGWMIPTLISAILALTTPISPWILGAIAALIIAFGYLFGWLIRRPRRAQNTAQK